MAKAATKAQPWKDAGLTKPEWIAREVAKAVNAGKEWNLETVDFSDPARPMTCLEVDFPIIPVNQLSALEAASGAAKKPIYGMSKWWARRPSSIFRAVLLAAAMKAPDEPAEAAKLVWDVYYGNHQKKGAFKHLKVADIFMGGGTTIVEGSRLGMQMYGNDLNPVAWFIVKNELANVDKAEVEKLLAEIEAEVKPQIMPFYTCDCPRGHKGKWTQISSGKVMGKSFDPLALTPEQRKDYRYEGPEVIYTFWAKHGPCQVTGCGHRTPIMSSPVMAVKTLSVKAWKRKCRHCGKQYGIEQHEARMAPGVPLVVAETERPYAVAELNFVGDPESAVCPHCEKEERFGSLGKAANKKVELSLLVHPDWLKGAPSKDAKGRAYGGCADDCVEATARWNQARTPASKLIEFRGKLPEQFVCPTTGVKIWTGKGGGTVPPGVSKFVCGNCGNADSVIDCIKATGKSGPIAIYAVQGFCPRCLENGELNGGRFFMPPADICTLNAAFHEWAVRKNGDLADFWPKCEIPFGERTHIKDPLPKHGFRRWCDLFNSRQLLVHAALLKAITTCRGSGVNDYVLGAFQQYLRLNNMFSIWHLQNNQISASMSNNNYNPKTTSLEPGVFAVVGDGSWRSAAKPLLSVPDWRLSPTELVPNNRFARAQTQLRGLISGKSEKAFCGDPVQSVQIIECSSSTDLSSLSTESCDAVITDPPFGGILQYAELADFFYVWLRLALKEEEYPQYFAAEHSPKAIEAVGNTARHDDPDAFYQRIMTECWREASRVLKSGGLLAFTFHHSQDSAWVAVLESLFDAGFYLQATYPIRGDESKGENAEFGSKMIEYDIIHVCRKRHHEPKQISWAKLRRQVLQDVRELQELLEHHQDEGLPEADLQVIRRGKALEYFSRHYGKVFKGPDTPMTVLEALLGINQLLDEESGGIKEPPPHNAEPFTRMLLRLFDGHAQLPRDQMQKFLRGTGSAPSDFVQRGWLSEQKKIFHLVPPLDLARQWVGKQRRGMISDYDQAMFFIGACFDGSGISAGETLNNPNFLPHPALGAILTWFKTHGADSPTRNAASVAAQLYRTWEGKNQAKAAQLSLFDKLGEETE